MLPHGGKRRCNNPDKTLRSIRDEKSQKKPFYDFYQSIIIALYNSYASNYQTFCRNHKCREKVLQKLFDRRERICGHIGRKSFMSTTPNFIMSSKFNSIGVFYWNKTFGLHSGNVQCQMQQPLPKSLETDNFPSYPKFPKTSYRKLFFHLIFAQETEFSDILAIFGFFGK